MTHLEATFSIDGWDPRPDEIPAVDGAPATGRAVLHKTYAGDLVGTAVAEFMSTGQIAYLAQERIEGTLGGRAGSFVLQHGASGGSGAEPQQWAFVVPGSGAGELAGLRGTGMLAHELITLDWELPG
jgi:hypothetical protein